MPTRFLLLPPLEFSGGRKLLDAAVPVVPCLPTEILLEIFLCTDPATLVRCAATSKDHLRCVADPAFLRRYGHRLDSRFVPSLLLGLYCVDDDYSNEEEHNDNNVDEEEEDEEDDGDDNEEDDDDDELIRIMVAPGPDLAPAPCRSLAEDTVATLNDWKYTPVAACGGLLFAKDLMSYGTNPDLVKGRVIDTSSRPQLYTYTKIPKADIGYASLVLLLPDDHEEVKNGLVDFRLVAVDVTLFTNVAQIRLRAQMFRSQSGKWDWVPGNPMEVSLPGDSPCTWYDTYAAVLRTNAGAVANLLCKSDVSYHVVSFNIDDAQVGVIDLPLGCQDPWRESKELLLAPSADRKRLTLLVADGLKINVWIWTQSANPTETGCWALQMVIDVLGAARELSHRWPLPRPVDSQDQVMFERWFGERSGTAVLEIDGCGHFALNVATKKLQLLKEFSETVDMWLLCGHEINPLPLLRKLQLLNFA